MGLRHNREATHHPDPVSLGEWAKCLLPDNVLTLLLRRTTRKLEYLSYAPHGARGDLVVSSIDEETNDR